MPPGRAPGLREPFRATLPPGTGTLEPRPVRREYRLGFNSTCKARAGTLRVMFRRPGPPHAPHRVTSRRSRRRGQALVEFALVLPAFLLLLVIAVDFGRLFFSYIEINNAAREGASYAATNPTDTSGIQAHILQETNAQSQAGAGAISMPIVTCKDTTGATMACSAAAGGSGPGNTVTVSVDEPFTFYTPLVNNFFNNNLSLGSSATAAVLGFTASSGGTPPPGSCTTPTASFTVVVNGMQVTTDPSASTPNSGVYNISGYNWDWGDGNTDVGTASATTHTYLANGTYQIALTTTNQCGSATARYNLAIGTVAPPCTVPTASFTYTSSGNTFHFTDKSTVADPVNCPITTWAWNFGDGNGNRADTLSNTQNPTFTYSDSGKHTVTLVVTNSAGPSNPSASKQ
jgi:PKD repeat protein